MGDVTVREAGAADLAAVLQVQQEAFSRVARMFDIPEDSLPPLRETLGDLQARLDSGMRFFVAEVGSEVVGSVRGMRDKDTVEIGRLVVDGRFLRRGVATALMDALESGFEGVCRFILFTGSEADVPLALYTGRGYKEFDREVHPHVELVWLEKRMEQH